MGLISFGKVQKIVFLRSRSRALTRVHAHACARARVNHCFLKVLNFLKVLKKSFKKCRLFECFENMSKNIQ